MRVLGLKRQPGKQSSLLSLNKITENTDEITFEVTQDHINRGLAVRGTERARYYCPVAIAIKEVVGVGVTVGWGYAAIYWFDGIKPTQYTVKDYGFVRRFDTGDFVTPFRGSIVKDG